MVFLTHTELRCTVNHTSDLRLGRLVTDSRSFLHKFTTLISARRLVTTITVDRSLGDLINNRLIRCQISIVQYNSVYPDAGYPDRLSPSSKYVENSTKLTCLELIGYRIQYSTVSWLLELQTRRVRKV